MSYTEEFPDTAIPGPIIELVRDKVLTDESWHNDVCPHFEAIIIGRTNDEPNTVVQLWCDFEDAERREMNGTRFSVIITNNPMTEDAVTVCETDDVYEAISVTMAVIQKYKDGNNIDLKAIAKRFVSNLEADLTPDQMRTISQRNAHAGMAKSCASHDFCDANIVMHEAFTACQPEYYINPDDQQQAEQWSAAWDLAKVIIAERYPVAPVAERGE